MLIRSRWLVAGLLLTTIAGGCSVFESRYTVDEGTSAAEILARAKERVDRRHYERAGDLYLEVERLHPYSVEAKIALIEAAKAYHEDSKHAESRAAARRYLDFYPSGAEAPLAQYLVALSYYDQIIDVKRDQSNSFNAMKEFRRLMETYPGSAYQTLAEEKFAIALDQLAGKEMDIGRYYLFRHNYVAAINRFEAVAKEYGQSRHRPEALYRLVEAYLSLGLLREATAAAATLSAEYPGNEWTADAAAQMAQHG